MSTVRGKSRGHHHNPPSGSSSEDMGSRTRVDRDTQRSALLGNNPPDLSIRSESRGTTVSTTSSNREESINLIITGLSGLQVSLSNLEKTVSKTGEHDDEIRGIVNGLAKAHGEFIREFAVFASDIRGRIDKLDRTMTEVRAGMNITREPVAPMMSKAAPQGKDGGFWDKY